MLVRQRSLALLVTMSQLFWLSDRHINFQHASAVCSALWQALPNAVYDDSSKTLTVATGFAPLAICKSIYVRDCHTQLTNLALQMTPFDISAGMMKAHLGAALNVSSHHADVDMPFVFYQYIKGCLTCTAGFIGTGHEFNKMLVTGTPGTGKTYWQIHLLWHLARKGATVVLDWNDSEYKYLLSRLDFGICCSPSTASLLLATAALIQHSELCFMLT